MSVIAAILSPRLYQSSAHNVCSLVSSTDYQLCSHLGHLPTLGQHYHHSQTVVTTTTVLPPPTLLLHCGATTEAPPLGARPWLPAVAPSEGQHHKILHVQSYLNIATAAATQHFGGRQCYLNSCLALP